VTVRPALAAEVELVRAIGIAAGERFRSDPDPRISARADDRAHEIAELAAAVAEGRLLVAVDDRSGDVAGFLLVEVVDGHAHVGEVSVHPEHEGRGLASALLAALEDPVTLTTFRDVAWNRPFYERRGFRVLDDAELTGELRAVVAHEATLGLDPSIRVVMVRGAL
jgi:ribosomal protein S18 acetylase RimI-like enzyme